MIKLINHFKAFSNMFITPDKATNKKSIPASSKTGDKQAPDAFRFSFQPEFSAYNHSYLSHRKLHPGEPLLKMGPVQIVDKASSSLKMRHAVLCPTRLLLFKHPVGQENK